MHSDERFGSLEDIREVTYFVYRVFRHDFVNSREGERWWDNGILVTITPDDRTNLTPRETSEFEVVAR
jgi:hypothetical protein